MICDGLVFSSLNLAIAALALLLERFFGYSHWLESRIGHPVAWMGALIRLLDRWLNDADMSARDRQLRGALALALLITAVGFVAISLAVFLRALPLGWLLESALAASLLSQKSLREAVQAVASGLERSLEAGRDAVRHIVGRDASALDQTGVARGAIESLAENMSDGVTAPLIWLAIAGLPGIAVYKAINTADSMIGYRNDKYRDFGWAAARLDDLVNLPASRLTGFVLCLAAAAKGDGRGRTALHAMRHDATKHVSPNAGWPEAAMAGALGIRLGGPRAYQGRTVELPWMGDGRIDITPDDIQDALSLYGDGLNILLVLVVGSWMLSGLV